MAVVGTIARRRVIVDATIEAVNHGVRVGMTLAESQALCPALIVIEQDDAGDRRALDALGRWMTRFTPVVATGWDDADGSGTCIDTKRRRISKSILQKSNGLDASQNPPVLFLDLTGCERAVGPAEVVARRVSGALRRFGIPAWVAVAPTPGAAWALASSYAGQAVVESAELRDRLAPLPVASLRVGSAIVAALHHLGVGTIGQLLVLPREALPARFGPLLLMRIDQALGARPEPLMALPYETPVIARREFDHAVDAVDALWMIFQDLLNTVVADLTRRGRGARRLRLTCTPDHASRRPPVVKEVQLSRATRDLKSMTHLLRCATERLEAAGDGADSGYVTFRLDVPEHESVTDEQAVLFGEDAVHHPVEVDRLIDRLRVRLGEAAVIRPQAVASHLPERAWRVADVGAAAGGRADPYALARPTDLGAPVFTSQTPPLVLSLRPTCLLPTPIEVRVVSEPSDDREGHPRQFTWQGQVHRIVLVFGPERICGEWWRGHHRTRDYYEVEDDSARRFWLFRVIRLLPDSPDETMKRISVRWFVHGRFQ